MRRWVVLLGVALAAVTVAAVANPAPTEAAGIVRVRTFYPVGGSGVAGQVRLTELPGGRTRITVVAFGLRPGGEYLSLTYDNRVCALEPYSNRDVIGSVYRANGGGVGVISAVVADNIRVIDSVSVRRAGDFALLACANTDLIRVGYGGLGPVYGGSSY